MKASKTIGVLAIGGIGIFLLYKSLFSGIKKAPTDPDVPKEKTGLESVAPILKSGLKKATDKITAGGSVGTGVAAGLTAVAVAGTALILTKAITNFFWNQDKNDPLWQKIEADLKQAMLDGKTILTNISKGSLKAP